MPQLVCPQNLVAMIKNGILKLDQGYCCFPSALDDVMTIKYCGKISSKLQKEEYE